jgi:chorismate-pyruvate lyase
MNPPEAMPAAANASAPDTFIARLCAALPGRLGAADLEPVAAAALPPPWASLLDHRGHMTAVVEAYHGAPVAVQVLQRRHAAPVYAREILLSLPTGRIVQYAVVVIALDRCPQPVGAQILAEREPLGRVLQALSPDLRVEPVGFVRVRAPAALAESFAVAAGTVVWGRLVRIHHGPECLIEGLEVLAPP